MLTVNIYKHNEFYLPLKNYSHFNEFDLVFFIYYRCTHLYLQRNFITNFKVRFRVFINSQSQGKLSGC